MKWNVEEMKLMNEKCQRFIGNERIFACESISREEKIEMIDEYNKGKMTYFLALVEKFQNDKSSLPQTWYGSVKTISLIAWLKRNDDRKLVDIKYTTGEIRFLGTTRYIYNFDSKNMYDIYENIIDECFHRMLISLEREEKKYFLENDEYSVLKKQLSGNENYYRTTFGVPLSFSSSGEIKVYDIEGKNSREITIDEVKLLLSKYDELEKVIEKISGEISIVY